MNSHDKSQINISLSDNTMRNEQSEGPPYHVYRIDKVDTYGNSHGVNRDETWSVVLDKTFTNKEEALNYIIHMNRKWCRYELGTLYTNNQEFIAERCTDIKWCHKQRYFLGRPNLKLIREYLNKDGVTTIVNNQKSK